MSAYQTPSSAADERADPIAHLEALIREAARSILERLLGAEIDEYLGRGRYERGAPFQDLSPARRTWLVQTGARYVWTDPQVIAARRTLYSNLRLVLPDPHGYVVERIIAVMDTYVRAFHLFDANELLGLTS